MMEMFAIGCFAGWVNIMDVYVMFVAFSFQDTHQLPQFLTHFPSCYEVHESWVEVRMSWAVFTRRNRSLFSTCQYVCFRGLAQSDPFAAVVFASACPGHFRMEVPFIDISAALTRPKQFEVDVSAFMFVA